MNKEQSFVSGRIKSIKYAVLGALHLIKTEHSIMVQFSIGVIMTLMGFIFDITKAEWILQTMAIACVLAVEGLNTAVEKIADFIHPDFHVKIGEIKDVAAGAVFFVALGAIAAGVIIYLPYIQELF